MALRLNDIIQFPTMKGIRVVAGCDSLDKIVRWVHVIEIPKVTQWLNGGELVFITGIGIKSDTEALIQLVNELDSKNIAGLVIFCGPYIEMVPLEVINLANDLNFPVFEIPWEAKLIDITKEICSSIIMFQTEEKATWHLLEEILFFQSDSYENIITRAIFYGYDLKAKHQAIIYDIDNFKLFIKERNINNEEKILEIKNTFRKIVLDTFLNHKIKALSMIQSDAIIILALLDNESTQNKTVEISKEIQKNITMQLNGASVSVGLGEVYSHIDDAKKSFSEAEFAIKALKFKDKDNDICSYGELGIYKLLMKVSNRSELEDFCMDTIGALIEYDKQYATNYMNTLNNYVNENYSISRTAVAMYTHKNTLKYRMKRIEEILGFDFKAPDKRLNVQLGLTLYNWLMTKKS